MARPIPGKDLPGIISYFSPECCGYGTGPDEEARDQATFSAHLARDLDQCDQVTVRFKNVFLNGEGHIAWMMADCTYDLVMRGKDLAMTGRMTGVIRKAGNRWLFELVHLSVPYAGQEVGEPYPGYGSTRFNNSITPCISPGSRTAPASSSSPRRSFPPTTPWNERERDIMWRRSRSAQRTS